MKKILVAAAIAAAVSLAGTGAAGPSPASGAATGLSGTIRLPWYNEPGDPLGCPGAGPYRRWKIVVAVRQSDSRFRCGDRVELRYRGQTVVATVADHFSERAPSWVVLDAAAILNCRLLLPPRERTPKPRGYVKNCATISGVEWRRLPRR